MSSLEKLKQDVMAVQEKVSQELASKITKLSYKLRRKSNKMQFNFNSSIEDTLSAAKQQLLHVNPTERGQQEALQKAQVCLDEGMKALEKHQKHIKVAD